MITSVISELVGAVVLGWLGYLAWTRALDYRRRELEFSQTLRQPWRSLLYPLWYWRSDALAISMRGFSIGAFLMAIALVVLAISSLFAGHSS